MPTILGVEKVPTLIVVVVVDEDVVMDVEVVMVMVK